MNLSMESRVDMPKFHMESSGIQVEWQWIPYGIDHSMTIPWSFHRESMMSMEQQIGCGLSQHWFHGFHMDSIWINLGKVKTSMYTMIWEYVNTWIHEYKDTRICEYMVFHGLRLLWIPIHSQKCSTILFTKQLTHYKDVSILIFVFLPFFSPIAHETYNLLFL